MNLYRDETAPYAAVCGYERNSPFPGEKLTLAIAAVPTQPWETPLSPAVGLKQGNIFPSLVLPFFKEGGNAHV